MEHGDKLNAISLFSGIGGFELGLSDYCRTLLYCEADAHAQAVLLSRMAEGAIDVAPISTDVREITAEFVDMPIDIIFGGFPCQDISCAGKGVGLDGERSGLFFEIVRLAGEIKPTFLFLENVSAIRTRGLDRVILELTEVGYDLRWCMLSAADVGAPHRRERWFLLAARRDALANPESIGSGRELRDVSGENAEIGQPEEQHEDKAREPEPTGINTPVLADTESSQPWQPTERQWGENPSRRSDDCRRSERAWEGDLADTESIGVQGLRTSGQPQPDPHGQSGLPVCQSEKYGDERPTESSMGRLADGVSLDVVESRKAYLDPNYWKDEPEGIARVTEDREQRVDRIKRLGNAVVPLQAKTAFEYLMGIYKENNPNLIMPMPLIIPKPRPVVEYEEVEW